MRSSTGTPSLYPLENLKARNLKRFRFHKAPRNRFFKSCTFFSGMDNVYTLFPTEKETFVWDYNQFFKLKVMDILIIDLIKLTRVPW